MIPTSTDLGNKLLATSFATALASADCFTLTGVNATTSKAFPASPGVPAAPAGLLVASVPLFATPAALLAASMALPTA